MPWIVHSTVPYPMLKEPGTPRMLSDAGVGPEIYLSGATLDAITPVEAAKITHMMTVPSASPPGVMLAPHR